MHFPTWADNADDADESWDHGSGFARSGVAKFGTLVAGSLVTWFLGDGSGVDSGMSWMGKVVEEESERERDTVGTLIVLVSSLG